MTPFESVVVISTDVGAGTDSTEVIVAAGSVIQGYECWPPWPEVQAVSTGADA
jgi:hypothetical protein